MSTIKSLYGTNNQSIAVTAAAAMTTGQQASSASVDNTTNLFMDALVSCSFTVGTVVAPSYINIYAAGTTDGGTTYGGGETSMGTDHTVTLTVPPQIRLIGILNCPTNTTAYKISALSVAAAFGGVLPDHWCLVFENKTSSTISAGSCNYQGIQAQVV